MDTLKRLGQIDISVSPLHHPILPLLCDSESAKEAMPFTPMPSPIYKYPQDAHFQILKGIDVFKKYFKTMPTGM